MPAGEASASSRIDDDDLDADLRALADCFVYLAAADRTALIAMACAMKPAGLDRIHETVRHEDASITLIQ